MLLHRQQIPAPARSTPIKHALPVVLIVLLTGFLGSRVSRADAKFAWRALHALEITEAKHLFQEEIQRDPDNPSLHRGLLLASFFDLDHALEVEAIASLLDPRFVDPCLLSIFEHVAVEMSEWEEQVLLKEESSKALIRNGNPAMAYAGRCNLLNLAFSGMEYPSAQDRKALGLATGFWVAGPFDNRSNVVMFRNVPFEKEALDTLAVAIGREGSKAGWTWLPTDDYGNLFPHRVMEDMDEIACHMRAFVQLPVEDDVLILLGGAFNYRILVDGFLIGTDHVMRNAVIREGYRVHLAKGRHEITIIPGLQSAAASVSLSILDSLYAPIEGLRWLRDAESPRPLAKLEAERIHPLFDSFDEFSRQSNGASDARFWKATLMNLNGYAKEVIEELEPLYERGEMSLLETWPLYKAFVYSGEELRASKLLAHLGEATTAPLVRVVWTTETVQDWEARINTFGALGETYPDRYEIELMRHFRPQLTRDYGGSIAILDTLLSKYPNASLTHELKSNAYARLGDYKSALEEVSRLTKQTRTVYGNCRGRSSSTIRWTDMTSPSRHSAEASTDSLAHWAVGNSSTP